MPAYFSKLPRSTGPVSIRELPGALFNKNEGQRVMVSYTVLGLAPSLADRSNRFLRLRFPSQLLQIKSTRTEVVEYDQRGE
jgi:hypothetical protein